MRSFCSIEDVGVLSILTYIITGFYRIEVHDSILPFKLQLRWNGCARTLKALQLHTFAPHPLVEYCQQWSILFTLAASIWNWQIFSFLYYPYKEMNETSMEINFSVFKSGQFYVGMSLVQCMLWNLVVHLFQWNALRVGFESQWSLFTFSQVEEAFCGWCIGVWHCFTTVTVI